MQRLDKMLWYNNSNKKNMKKEIKKINVGKVAMMSGFLSFAVILIASVITSISIFVLYQVLLKSLNFADLISGILGGLLTAVLMGVFISIIFTLLALLYNIGARFFGGLIYETEEVKEKKTTLFEEVDKDNK